MAQNTNVILSTPSYTRGDFTALRAWVQRIPVDRIANLYYTDDAPQVSQSLEKYLTAMRHDLIERAIVANPRLADALTKARAGGLITTGILSLLVNASNAKPSPPKASDFCSQWFRPGAARAIAQLNTPTLGDLKNHIERSGPNWWRPLPRLGEKRAKVIMQWLNRHEATFIRPETQIVVLDTQNLSPLGNTTHYPSNALPPSPTPWMDIMGAIEPVFFVLSKPATTLRPFVLTLRNSEISPTPNEPTNANLSGFCFGA
ncbi:phage integrase family protein [Limnohabitans sp. TEGF004]|uniref:phage integrase family protein n=1 Tax=Limnohabitans sp. TEGF004 TaxID=2986281 RepID=UPI0024939096|nr:phage integrase family protein [Limnohabitans sp. TEGF004]